MLFNDRHHAGVLLSEKIPLEGKQYLVVFGLARGGIIVASSLALKLKLPLDLLVIKKISSPFESELAIGALAPEGVSYIDWPMAQRTGADENYIKTQIANLSIQIKQKTLLYRKGNKPINIRNQKIILVDDGAATGATMEAAIKWLKKRHAAQIVVALPVAPHNVAAKIRPEVDELVVLETPSDFSAVGQFYKEFPQVSDEEVVKLAREHDSNLVK